MDPKSQVLPLVSEAIDCAIENADEFQRRITALAELAKTVAELKVALKNDPSGLPVIPLTIQAKADAAAFAILAKASSARALAAFL